MTVTRKTIFNRIMLLWLVATIAVVSGCSNRYEAQIDIRKQRVQDQLLKLKRRLHNLVCLFSLLSGLKDFLW